MLRQWIDLLFRAIVNSETASYWSPNKAADNSYLFMQDSVDGNRSLMATKVALASRLRPTHPRPGTQTFFSTQHPISLSLPKPIKTSTAAFALSVFAKAFSGNRQGVLGGRSNRNHQSAHYWYGSQCKTDNDASFAFLVDGATTTHRCSQRWSVDKPLTSLNPELTTNKVSQLPQDQMITTLTWPGQGDKLVYIANVPEYRLVARHCYR